MNLTKRQLLLLIKFLFTIIIVALLILLIQNWHDYYFRKFNFKLQNPQLSSIEIKNNGKETAAFGITLNNNKFFSNNNEVLNEIIGMPPEYEGEPLYRRTWRFIINNSYHYPPITGNNWLNSPALFLNSVGFGFCDDSANLFCNILQLAGYETRIWDIYGHVIPEVLINGKWEMYDPDLKVYYLTKDNKVAGVEELAKKPDLITSPYKQVQSDPFPYSSYVSSLYSTTNNNSIGSSKDIYPNYDLIFRIPPGGKIVFPGKFHYPLLTIDPNYPVKNYSNLKYTVPKGWTGNINIPLVIHTIYGKGKIRIGSTEYDVGSKALQQHLESQQIIPDFNIKIINSPEDINIVYLINPMRFNLASNNKLYLEGIYLQHLSFKVVTNTPD